MITHLMDTQKPTRLYTIRGELHNVWITSPIKIKLVGFLCIQSYSLVCPMKTTSTREGLFGCVGVLWGNTLKSHKSRFVLLKGFTYKVLMKCFITAPLVWSWGYYLPGEPFATGDEVGKHFIFQSRMFQVFSISQNAARKPNSLSSSWSISSCAFMVFSQISKQMAHGHF